MAHKKKLFNPRLRYQELECLVGDSGLIHKRIENSLIYALIQKLTSAALPTFKDEFDKRWHYFYLPLKKGGRLICLPFGIVQYNQEFFIGFQGLGNIQVCKGKSKIEKEYGSLFHESIRFIPVLKKDAPAILERTVPYDIRTGKIKGKHVLQKLMPEKEKRKILQRYQEHLRRKLEIAGISLNEYLDTAALCYLAAYGRKTENLSPLEMYKKWGDGRHGGMLDIKARNSRKAFINWLQSSQWAGSHPFEIVFSWHRHGIHLYPPDSSPHYILQVTNYAYARDYLNMVNALIDKEVPFKARDLEEVVHYLAGETYFKVNEYDEHSFCYIPSREYRKIYFPHIEWDELKVPLWK